jgi:MoaA/NifB/PqqE/SkfB family radical SAM enzyme
MKWRQKIGCLGAVIGANISGRRQPISTQYAVTNRCPWRCSYCNIANATREERSPADALRIVDDLARAGVYRLHLVGGEPMLRDDLGEIVGRARSHGLYVTMATSGVRIPSLIEQVRGVDLFMLSFDGPEEIHDRQRGSGSYRVLREAMETLRREGREIWTTTVVTGGNIDSVETILKTARQERFICNFHLLYFAPGASRPPGYIHPERCAEGLEVAPDRYRELLRYLIRRKQTDLGGTIGNSLAYLRALLAWDDLTRAYRPEKDPGYSCWAGRLFAYVDSNGDLYPCCDVIGRVPGRNILEMGFEKAWAGLPAAPCRSCIVACYTEMNLMFSLNPRAICNWAVKV